VPIPTLQHGTPSIGGGYGQRGLARAPLGTLLNPRTIRNLITQDERHTHVCVDFPFPSVMADADDRNNIRPSISVGGHGAASHAGNGFRAQRATCGSIWRAPLIEDHTVCPQPDLVGWPLAKPDGGSEKRIRRGRDGRSWTLWVCVTRPNFGDPHLGVIVGFALVRHPGPSAVADGWRSDARCPGVGLWDQIKQNPSMWHFVGFGGPDMERLGPVRARIYLESRPLLELTVPGPEAIWMKRSRAALCALMLNRALMRSGSSPVPDVGQDAG